MKKTAFVPDQLHYQYQYLLIEEKKMDQIVAYVKPLKEFAKDSMRLVKRCTKPDLKGTNKLDLVLMRSL